MEGMKESENRWIGLIPDSWQTKRVKYLATLKGRIGWQGLTSDEYQDEGAYLITGVDFKDGAIAWESCEHVPMKRWEEAKDIQIENGDLLITKDGTIGKVAVVSDMPGETSLNSGVLRIMTYAGYNRKYLYWVLQSDVFWNWFNFKNAGNSTIQHLYQGDFAEFIYAYPEEEEQQAIADFLDDKCSQIDGIISDIEKQIEILKSYKKSLITETVTKGLDKNVKMKDSGKIWIGSVPESWNTKRVKYLATLKGRIGWQGLTSDEYQDEGAYLITGVNFLNGCINWETCEHVPMKRWEEAKDIQIENGDLLITKDGTIGKVAVVSNIPGETSLNSGVLRIMTYEGYNRKYLYWVLQSDVFWNWFNFKNAGNSTIQHLYQGDFAEFIYAYPNENEQQKIADYLDSQCTQLDSIINTKQTQLTQMQQHKKSLIYEYVTGKKRVQGFGD